MDALVAEVDYALAGLVDVLAWLPLALFLSCSEELIRRGDIYVFDYGGLRRGFELGVFG